MSGRETANESKSNFRRSKRQVAQKKIDYRESTESADVSEKTWDAEKMDESASRDGAAGGAQRQPDAKEAANPQKKPDTTKKKRKNKARKRQTPTQRALVYGHWIEDDGKLRLKPGTSNEFISKIEWARWQYEEATKRNRMRRADQIKQGDFNPSDGRKRASNFVEEELTPRQRAGLLRMREKRELKRFKLWYHREVLLLKSAKAIVEHLSEDVYDPATCVRLLNELRPIPFPHNMIKKNFWILEILNELTYHEHSELAETAEKVFNKFRCLFAVRWGHNVMEELYEQAVRHREALRSVIRKARRKSNTTAGKDVFDTLWSAHLYRSAADVKDGKPDALADGYFDFTEEQVAKIEEELGVQFEDDTEGKAKDGAHTNANAFSDDCDSAASDIYLTAATAPGGAAPDKSVHGIQPEKDDAKDRKKIRRHLQQMGLGVKSSNRVKTPKTSSLSCDSLESMLNSPELAMGSAAGMLGSGSDHMYAVPKTSVPTECPRTAIRIPSNVSRKNSNLSRQCQEFSSSHKKPESEEKEKQDKVSCKNKFNMRIKLEPRMSNSAPALEIPRKEVERCLKALRAIEVIKFTKDMLQKKDTIVEKVRKFSSYANERVSGLANEILQKFQCILEGKPSGEKTKRRKSLPSRSKEMQPSTAQAETEVGGTAAPVISLDPGRMVSIEGVMFFEMETDRQEEDSNWWGSDDALPDPLEAGDIDLEEFIAAYEGIDESPLEGTDLPVITPCDFPKDFILNDAQPTTGESSEEQISSGPEIDQSQINQRQPSASNRYADLDSEVKFNSKYMTEGLPNAGLLLNDQARQGQAFIADGSYGSSERRPISDHSSVDLKGQLSYANAAIVNGDLVQRSAVTLNEQSTSKQNVVGNSFAQKSVSNSDNVPSSDSYTSPPKLSPAPVEGHAKGASPDSEPSLAGKSRVYGGEGEAQSQPVVESSVPDPFAKEIAKRLAKKATEVVSPVLYTYSDVTESDAALSKPGRKRRKTPDELLLLETDFDWGCYGKRLRRGALKNTSSKENKSTTGKTLQSIVKIESSDDRCDDSEAVTQTSANRIVNRSEPSLKSARKKSKRGKHRSSKWRSVPTSRSESSSPTPKGKASSRNARKKHPKPKTEHSGEQRKRRMSEEATISGDTVETENADCYSSVSGEKARKRRKRTNPDVMCLKDAQELQLSAQPEPLRVAESDSLCEVTTTETPSYNALRGESHARESAESEHRIAEPVVTCPVCGTSYRSESSLISHLRNFHRTNTLPYLYKCPFIKCTKKKEYTTLRAMKYHVLFVHKVYDKDYSPDEIDFRHNPEFKAGLVRLKHKLSSRKAKRVKNKGKRQPNGAGNKTSQDDLSTTGTSSDDPGKRRLRSAPATPAPVSGFMLATTPRKRRSRSVGSQHVPHAGECGRVTTRSASLRGTGSVTNPVPSQAIVGWQRFRDADGEKMVPETDFLGARQLNIKTEPVEEEAEVIGVIIPQRKSASTPATPVSVRDHVTSVVCQHSRRRSSSESLGRKDVGERKRAARKKCRRASGGDGGFVRCKEEAESGTDDSHGSALRCVSAPYTPANQRALVTWRGIGNTRDPENRTHWLKRENGRDLTGGHVDIKDSYSDTGRVTGLQHWPSKRQKSVSVTSPEDAQGMVLGEPMKARRDAMPCEEMRVEAEVNCVEGKADITKKVESRRLLRDLHDSTSGQVHDRGESRRACLYVNEIDSKSAYAAVKTLIVECRVRLKRLQPSDFKRFRCTMATKMFCSKYVRSTGAPGGCSVRVAEETDQGHFKRRRRRERKPPGKRGKCTRRSAAGGRKSKGAQKSVDVGLKSEKSCQGLQIAAECERRQSNRSPSEWKVVPESTNKRLASNADNGLWVNHREPHDAAMAVNVVVVNHVTCAETPGTMHSPGTARQDGARDVSTRHQSGSDPAQNVLSMNKIVPEGAVEAVKTVTLRLDLSLQRLCSVDHSNISLSGDSRPSLVDIKQEGSIELDHTYHRRRTMSESRSYTNLSSAYCYRKRSVSDSQIYLQRKGGKNESQGNRCKSESRFGSKGSDLENRHLRNSEKRSDARRKRSKSESQCCCGAKERDICRPRSSSELHCFSGDFDHDYYRRQQKSESERSKECSENETQCSSRAAM